MINRKYKSWKKSYLFRKKYCTFQRGPFYDIVAKYIPDNKNAVILDIGAGEGEFVDYLNLKGKYSNLFLLDANKNTVEFLKKRFDNVLFYKVPNELPFHARTVDFIHCSHIIEHLYSEELYTFLREVDRILKVNGIFAVSTPLLWKGFYGDLTHIRPYNPSIFRNYLCSNSKNRSRQIIATTYSELELVYRYREMDFSEGWGSTVAIVDLIMQLSKRIFSKLGFRKYEINGYTLVLQKNSG